jgi:hypothetical protein
LAHPLQEPLLPTPNNINPVHLKGSDLLAFIHVQQWVGDKMRVRLPLLHGMFVLVPSAALQQQQQQPQPESSGRNGGSSDGGSSNPPAPAAAFPWQLRQIAAVEAGPGTQPRDATVVLVGGERVAAAAVPEGLTLAGAAGYQVGIELSMTTAQS